MVDFILAKCKTKASYSAKLKNPHKLALDAISKKFEVVIDTPVLVMIKVEGVEVVVHGYGELLFKECEDVELMEKIAKAIYEVGLER